MEHQTHTPDTAQPFRIPTLAWVILGGIVIALIAVYLFNVSWSTVGSAALLFLFMGSHFFMHGGHSGHGDHQAVNSQETHSAHVQPGIQSSQADGPAETTPTQKDEHAGHSGCC